MSHLLRIFNCAAYVPIAPPQRTTIGSSETFKYLCWSKISNYCPLLDPWQVISLPLNSRIVTFDETVFPSLGGDKNKYVQQERQELSWSVPTLSHLDPQLAQRVSNVRSILNIQNVVDSMPNAFSDIDKVTRSNTPAAHMPARLEIS